MVIFSGYHPCNRREGSLLSVESFTLHMNNKHSLRMQELCKFERFSGIAAKKRAITLSNASDSTNAVQGLYDVHMIRGIRLRDFSVSPHICVGCPC